MHSRNHPHFSRPTELRDFLEESVLRFNRPAFIPNDPIQIPHQFTLPTDIEIASFLTATIAWGNRTMIIRNAEKLLRAMGSSPTEFILNLPQQLPKELQYFKHRTFQPEDLHGFLVALHSIYSQEGSLEAVFKAAFEETGNLQTSISQFKQRFFQADHLPRTLKHISDPRKNSAAKRINMMLRWLVRRDEQGVDFGIWKSMPPSALSCPLDVHSGRIARKLGLLTRKQDDAKALAELDGNLRQMDPEDPAKYDFALFGLGVEGGF